MNPMRSVPLCLPANCRWDQGDQKVVFDPTTERGNLVLCQEGLDVLRSICKPVVVICITGPARSGKSFFLSQIQNGVQFEVGHGTTAKTTGIWIASTGKFVTKSGQEAEVILLDTEGLCSVSTMDNNTDATWDKKLFTLSLLLSSYFIFNSQGTPTFRDLDKLAFVGKLTDYLKSSRACKKVDRFNLLGSSPDFLWLVRDAYLQPEVQGERCGWNRFLKESVLKSRPDRRNDPKDLIRKAVVKTFGKIDAQGLPFPSVDPNVIEKLGSPEGTNVMQPAFIKSIQSVKKKIFAVAKEKTIKGRIVSGNDLAYFIEVYVEQLNSESSIIDAESTWECYVAVEEAENLYSNEMQLLREKMPCSSLEIRKCHNDAKRKAAKELWTRSQLSSQSAREIHTRKFDLNLENILKSYQSENQRLSREQCRKLKKDLLSRYLQPMFGDPSKFKVKNVKSAKDKALEDYDLMAEGPERDEIRLELVQEMTEMTLKIEKLVMHEATKKVLYLYEREMIALPLPCAKCNLNKKHGEALNLAINTFEEVCSGSETMFSRDFKQQLEKDIHDKMSSIAENNDCLSIEHCEKLMGNLITQHLDPLLNDLDHNSYQDLKQAAHVILENYDSTAIGPRAELVREQVICEVNNRLKQSQVQIAQMAVDRAVLMYKTHMRQITIPCSENRLYRRDIEAREQALEKFKTDLNNFPSSVIQRHEQNLRRDLDREFSFHKSENFSQSRQVCLHWAKKLEERHGLQHVLRNPQLRDEATVRKIVEEIMKEYKCRANALDSLAADEIQAEIQTKYNGIIKQCARESAEKIAAVATGIVVAGGFALWGLSKIFSRKDSDDED